MVFRKTLMTFCLSLVLGAGVWGQSGSLDFNVNDSDSVPLNDALHPKAPPKPLGPENPSDRSNFESGKSMLVPGHLLAGAGLLLSVVGAVSKSSGVNLIGSVMYLIGVPLTGVAAGKINDAAVKMRPSYVPEYRGWGYYWTGVGVGLWGSLLVTSGINDYNGVRTDADRDNASSSIGGGLLLAAIGDIFTMIAWGKFGFLAGEGSAAVPPAHALTLTPQFPLATDGKGPLGLTLSYYF